MRGNTVLFNPEEFWAGGLVQVQRVSLHSWGQGKPVVLAVLPSSRRGSLWTQASPSARRPAPLCSLEFGPVSWWGTHEGVQGKPRFPWFLQSGLLVSALPPRLCRVQIRKMWAQGLQSRTRSGAYSLTLHTHTHSSSLSAPAPTAISTPPGPYQRTKWTFFTPHRCVHTQASLGNRDALPSCLQLNVQAHTLSPSEQKHADI